MLQDKISWKVLKIFAQECSNDDLAWLDLDIFYGQVKFAFWAFILVEYMELVEYFGAK